MKWEGKEKSQARPPQGLGRKLWAIWGCRDGPEKVTWEWVEGEPTVVPGTTLSHWETKTTLRLGEIPCPSGSLAKRANLIQGSNNMWKVLFYFWGKLSAGTDAQMPMRNSSVSALREENRCTHSLNVISALMESTGCSGVPERQLGSTRREMWACMRGFCNGVHSAAVQSGNGEAKVITRFTVRTSPFQHGWHVLGFLPALTITYSETRAESNFPPPLDSCWLVLPSLSH